MSNPPASRGTGPASAQPDTSHLNGIQTSGRSYRNLSVAEHTMQREVDQKVKAGWPVALASSPG